MTNFNEWTNTPLYKNIISHTLFSKGWCLWCVIGEWRQGRTAILTQQYFFLILAGFAQLWVTEGPKPSVCHWLSLWHLVSNWFEPSVHLVILLFNEHLLPLFFHLFTQVHLLIDGSVKGQYITITNTNNFQKIYLTNKWDPKNDLYTYMVSSMTIWGIHWC